MDFSKTRSVNANGLARENNCKRKKPETHTETLAEDYLNQQQKKEGTHTLFATV
jgi:hypothetical protein